MFSAADLTGRERPGEQGVLLGNQLTDPVQLDQVAGVRLDVPVVEATDHVVELEQGADHVCVDLRGVGPTDTTVVDRSPGLGQAVERTDGVADRPLGLGVGN